MRITKTICTTLEIHPSEMTGLMSYIYLRKLNEKFVGRCYAASYILKINKIESSNLIMSRDKIGWGLVDIQFDCDCIIYQKDEIITGAKVFHRGKMGNIICIGEQTKYIASISDARDFKSVQKDQILSIRVIKATYSILKDHISIIASIDIIRDEIPKQQFEIALSKKVHEMEEFSDLLKRLNTEISAAKDIQSDKKTKARYDEFKKILYPYRTPPKYPTKLVKSIGDFKEGLILKWDAIGKDGLDILQSERKLPEMENSVLGDEFMSRSIESIRLLLLEKILYMVLLRELMDIYDDELFKSHKNVWTYYEKKLKK